MARLSGAQRPLVAALPLVLCACITDLSETDPLAAGRGEVSAAALEHGSCVDACGGVSDDGCWCDDLCATYGDCCPDYEAACVAPEEPEDTCLFDSDCGAGQACDVELSAPDGGPCCPPNAICIAIMPVCKGTCVEAAPDACSADQDCGAGSFCERPAGQCGGEGVCSPQTQMCTKIYAPVCGCDGNTYGNDCMAGAAGVSIAHEGECPLPEGQCASDADCGEGQHCQPIQCITAPCPPGICEDDAPAPAGDSCVDACGGSSADESCWCDEYCAAWGDCCADYQDACGA